MFRAATKGIPVKQSLVTRYLHCHKSNNIMYGMLFEHTDALQDLPSENIEEYSNGFCDFLMSLSLDFVSGYSLLCIGSHIEAIGDDETMGQFKACLAAALEQVEYRSEEFMIRKVSELGWYNL